MKQQDDSSRRGFLKAGSTLGLAIAFGPAAIREAFAESKSAVTSKEDTTAKTSAAERGSEPAGDGTAIRPFHVNFSEAEVTDLRRRVNATRWPEKETVTDTSQGVQLETTRALARYWGTDYDWHKCEARLKALPHFITEIDGLDIHFIHVRSKHANALPLIITHGWPGSVIEQLKVIEPLTNPTAHGGSASDAFDVVIPSLPGYGFTGKPTTTGWDPERIARAWTVLMKRLGYTKYVAQGGDWGNCVTELLALQAPPELLGIHTPTWRPLFQPTLTRLRLVELRRRRVSQPTNFMRTSSWPFSISTALATPSRWRTIRRRYTESRIRRWASRRGS